MKRRDFLQKLPLLAGAPFALNGIGFQPLYGQPKLRQLAHLSRNDKVLVIIQLHGGNDGLNAIIPINQYSEYYNLRPNIAVPDTGPRKYITMDYTAGDNQAVGLHPDMIGVKQLYDEGKLAIIQNAGYENMNGSHFKGRDIWFSGISYKDVGYNNIGYNDPVTSGWIGRYLEMEFEEMGYSYPQDSPNTAYPDPLGLEFSNEVSLGFHTEETIPAAISIPDPATFFDFVEGLEGYTEEINRLDPRGFPPQNLANSLYGQELNWILGIEKGTDKYASRLQTVYKAGHAFHSGVSYPQTYPLAAPKGSLHNPLSRNLEIVAKLLHGGCQTKVYLIRIGGFDNHVNQVESYDNTLGVHAALLHHVSSAMKAFQDDLKARGIEDKVLTVTMSEFGRRAKSNGSYGSDHGTVAPMMVFGKGINPGIIGKNPDLSKVETSGGNLSDQKEDITDFRVIFNTILQDWFDVEEAKIPLIFPSLAATASASTLDVQDKVPLFGNLTALDEFMHARFRLNNCQPNPVDSHTTFSFFINSPAHVSLELYDLQGQRIKVLLNEQRLPGQHSLLVNLSDLRAGTYLYRIHASLLKSTKKLIKR
jgi:uncharacterized protein (DUF1501 family)